MTHDELPDDVARFFGHVCGVTGVLLGLLGGWGLWHIGLAAVHGRLVFTAMTVTMLVLELVVIGLTVLMFRWAGALIGVWDTHGRLSVPKVVYRLMGYAFTAGGVAFGAMLWMHPPRKPIDLALGICAILGLGWVSHIAHSAAERFG